MYKRYKSSESSSSRIQTPYSRTSDQHGELRLHSRAPLHLSPPRRLDPLFHAAKTHPNVTFQAVINPDTGPSAPCPNTDYINATAYLNEYSNIQTLAYVHTAARYDCGPEADDICPCTQPLSALRSNITDYQNWNIPGRCTAQDIHLDGIFFDEAPSDGNCSSYMSDATAFARSTLTHGSTVLFNAGEAVDATYWRTADYVNVFEGTEAAYDTADIGALDGEGKYHGQTTMIIHSYTDGADIVARDVNTILSVTNDAMAGLYMTDLEVYSEFPTNWMAFVGQVAKVVERNKGLE